MEDLLAQFTATVDGSFSITTYVLNIVICAVLLFMLALVYNRFGNSISNRGQLAKVLVIVGLTTFIIISIVKSSLALSLGLVGALSIVRFRTAIKEPEELGYFFMAIAIGLGMGANQLLPTAIGFVILTTIIVIFRKSTFKGSITQNLLISTNVEASKQTITTEKIAEIISANSSQLEVKRINYAQGKASLNFMVKVDSLDGLNAIQKSLLAHDESMNITFIDNSI